MDTARCDIGGIAVVVAIVIGVVAYTAASTNEAHGPVGGAVNTVPRDRFGGAAIYPIPGGDPSDYLAPGVPLYVDCLQELGSKYLLARISDGLEKNHWIDVFDVKTPEGADVRFLKRPLPLCGPPAKFPAGSATPR